MGEVSSVNSQQSSRTIERTQQQENSNSNNDVRRTKLTKEMNNHIVWSYCIAIKTTLNIYRRAMFDLRNERYGMNFSEKRISDQR